MIRAIAAVVGGYASMFAFVFVSFSAAYLAVGAERAFKPGSYDPSLLWLVTSAALGLAAAVIGGLLCAIIARRGSRAPLVLAGLVLVFGLAMVLYPRPADDGPRTAAVGNLEAMGKARTPRSAAITNVVVGVAGILGGARLRRTSAEAV